MKRNNYGYPQQRRRDLTPPFFKYYFLTNFILGLIGLIFHYTKFGRGCLLVAGIMVIVFALSCAVAVMGEE